MKLAILAAAAVVAVPAAAQDAANHAGHTMPAPAATATATAAKFSLDTPVETLMADAKAKAVVDASLPDVAAHPSYEQFKGMSLAQLAPMAPDQLTADKLATIKAGLAAIK